MEKLKLYFITYKNSVQFFLGTEHCRSVEIFNENQYNALIDFLEKKYQLKNIDFINILEN